MRKPKGKLSMCASCSIKTYLECKRGGRQNKENICVPLGAKINES